MSDALVQLTDVHKVYGMGDAQVRALDGVTLRIDHQEFVAVMGASGSGKSTAMNISTCGASTWREAVLSPRASSRAGRPLACSATRCARSSSVR